jgi:hypothetical protein
MKPDKSVGIPVLSDRRLNTQPVAHEVIQRVEREVGVLLAIEVSVPGYGFFSEEASHLVPYGSTVGM